MGALSVELNPNKWHDYEDFNVFLGGEWALLDVNGDFGQIKWFIRVGFLGGLDFLNWR